MYKRFHFYVLYEMCHRPLSRVNLQSIVSASTERMFCLAFHIFQPMCMAYKQEALKIKYQPKRLI